MLKRMVSEQRNYSVLTAEQAKNIAIDYLNKNSFDISILGYGLPEIHDRYHEWKVPIMYKSSVIGDVFLDAYTRDINLERSSKIDSMLLRIKNADVIDANERVRSKKKREYKISKLSNSIYKGRAELVMKTLPDESVDLIFTSPPYYNARKEYSEYPEYSDYLRLMRQVIRESHRVLIDGKFFVINTSHVLVPRANRMESSRRVPVPFDIHKILIEEGFEFIDDIIWMKPEGAGWASGRGRRFFADRNPLQYKAVPVTEYVMVYRKKPLCLIDHFIRNHPNQDIINRSKIPDGYEKTNVWYICPAHDKRHPAIFPSELAEKVIMYYSFVNDVVLDPFGGIGTTAKAARKLGRRFCSIEVSEQYINATLNDMGYGDLTNILDQQIEYYDYSDLKSTNDLEPTVSDYITELNMQGFTEKEILEHLKKIHKTL